MGREKLDESERTVLKGLESQTGSYRELARLLRISHTTLDAVLRRLKTRGILRGIIYFVHPREIGRLPYKILITTQGLGPDLGEKLLKHPKVKACANHYVHSLGTWDHELNVAVATPLELSELCDTLQNDFADEISDFKTLALLRVLKRTTIPLVET